MLARRIVTAIATLLAVTGPGACRSVTEPQRPEPVAIAPSPATDLPPASQDIQAAQPARDIEAAQPARDIEVAQPATRDIQAAGQTTTGIRNVPAAFRLPPGSRVTALSDHESGASFTLTAPDPAAVLSFYRGELPRAAFTIVADRAEPGATSLAFRSTDGWAGTVYATTYRVTVAVRRA